MRERRIGDCTRDATVSVFKRMGDDKPEKRGRAAHETVHCAWRVKPFQYLRDFARVAVRRRRFEMHVRGVDATRQHSHRAFDVRKPVTDGNVGPVAVHDRK